MRVEDHKEKYDFIVSRAVTAFPDFVKLISKNIQTEGKNRIKNGILYLKGGDLSGELMTFLNRAVIYDIKDFFSESFFETKRIVYMPL
jgi:16S rRNA (guanine527-N7)-methyltransferase